MTARTQPQVFGAVARGRGLLPVLIVLGLGSGTARAANQVVTNTNNSGAGSLRQAIDDVGVGEEITFDPSVTGTITLGSTLSITKDMTITGPGAKVLAISGNDSVGVFEIGIGTVTIADLTIRNGNAGTGGGICTYNGSQLTLSRCAITQNAAVYGGGLFCEGSVLLSGCTFSGNAAMLGGGGICQNGTSGTITLTMTNCTISGNTSSECGAGLSVRALGAATPITELTNCTVYGNTTTGTGMESYGGGIAVTSNGSGHARLDFASTVIAGNDTAEHIYREVWVYAWTGTATLNSQDYNLIQNVDGASISGTTTNNITGQDPLLSALADNGGPTQTHALQAGSPAIDQIPNGTNGMGTAPLDEDQRGEARPSGAAGDIGAYELIPPPKTVTVGASGCDFTTIQGAIDDVGTFSGDTISVEDAVHTEQGITVSKSVIVQGYGPDNTIVQAHAVEGSATARVFTVESGMTVTIRDMTVRHGVESEACGGGIYSTGSLTVADCVIRDNHTSFVMEPAWGAGVFSNGTLVMTDCTVADNVTDSCGCGLYLRGTATLDRCTITGNEGPYGVGAAVIDGTSTFRNCTISGNTGSVGTGGVFVYGGTANVINCTVTANVSGTISYNAGGVYRSGGTLSLTSSIVAGNTDAAGQPDVYGPITSGGYNLIGINAGAESSFPAGQPNGNNDWVGTSGSPIDPLLSALADNGGPTQTHALQTGSPAMDQIPNGTNGMGTTPLDEDQRGEARPSRAAGDIGAFERQVTQPTVTTAAASNVTHNAADSGGEVTTDGGATVTACGVCWNTGGNPTTGDAKTEDGTGTGSFTSALTGLDPNVTYYVRAYATNSEGTAYGNEVSFTTDATTPTVTTTAASNVTHNAADGGGEVTADGGATVTARGVCWNTGGNPTTGDAKTEDGTGTGSFTSALTGLDPNVTYYVRAYATNSEGTVYGNEGSFTTDATTPTVTTTAASNVTHNAADSGGEVTANGGATVTARGVCWNTTGTPTTSDSKTEDGSGTGSFASSLTGLAPGMTYYVRAYATSSAGTAYGNEVSFTAGATTPTVTTTAASNVTHNAADSGGEVTANGGATVTARGVCWNTTGTPTTSDSKTEDGSGTGSFASNLTGLAPGTTYYVRAYATSSAGTAYGNEVSFTAGATTPTVTTTAASNVTHNAADSGGEVTANGGATVTARGVCWNTAGNPTTGDSKTEDGTGTGAFASSIAGLTPETTYYVRAYATSSAGTGYGDQVTFTTSAEPVTTSPPTVTTAAALNVTTTSADCGGNVSADGGATVTTRGVCWNATGNPTVAEDKTEDGTGTGSFASQLTGLTPNTTYYVRAYATNSEGTSYGVQKSFTTAELTPDLRVTIETDGNGDPNEPGDPNDGGGTVQVGQDVTVTVRVRNVGTGGATGVVLTFPLPPNVELIAAQTTPVPAAGQTVPNNVTVVDGVVAVQVGDVPAGQEVWVELVVRPASGGTISLDAAVGCDEAPTPVPADEAPELDVQDTYDQMITTHTPVGFCGLGGGAPLLILGILAGRLTVRRPRRRR